MSKYDEEKCVCGKPAPGSEKAAALLVKLIACGKSPKRSVKRILKEIP